MTVTNPAPGGGSSNAAEFIVQSGFGTGATGSVGWSNFARDERHTALSLSASQPLNLAHWTTPVDLDPQFSGTDLLIHYGSPSGHRAEHRDGSREDRRDLGIPRGRTQPQRTALCNGA